MKHFCSIITLSLLTSCGFFKAVKKTSKEIVTDNSPKVAKAMASKDFSCESKDIKIQKLPLRPAFCSQHGSDLYEASGCNQKAIYACRGSKSFDERCEVFEGATVGESDPCDSNL